MYINEVTITQRLDLLIEELGEKVNQGWIFTEEDMLSILEELVEVREGLYPGQGK